MTDEAQPRELLLALVNAVEGRDEEFRTWYWDTHIPEVVALPGFVSAQRYTSALPQEAGATHAYATLYEVEGSAAEALGVLFGGGLSSSDSLDSSSMVFSAFAPVGGPING